MESHHVSRVIAAAPDDACHYASVFANLPRWAAGLALADVNPDGDTDEP